MSRRHSTPIPILCSPSRPQRSGHPGFVTVSREISPITVEEYRPAPQHKKAFRPSEASVADVDEEGYRTVRSKRTVKSHLDAMRIPPGGNWSDHDAEYLDDLESLKPEEEDVTEESWDHRLEQARLEVLKGREANLAAKRHKRMMPPAPAAKDIRMTRDAPPSGIKEEPAQGEKACLGT